MGLWEKGMQSHMKGGRRVVSRVREERRVEEGRVGREGGISRNVLQ